MSGYRGIFPGTFTMGNVVCGFVSILKSIEGDVLTACWFVFLAAFLDALDGKVARLSRGSSQFGIELDSLADVISFGVAPAVVVFSLKLDPMGKLSWVVICTIYLMAAVYRLARYNVMAETDEKKDFLGLPVPGAALTLVSFVIFCDYLWGGVQHSQWLVIMVILLAFLMVSQVEYEMVPDHFHSRRSRMKLLVMISAGVAALLQPRLLLFPILSLYILFGIGKELYRLFYLGVGKVSSRPPRRRSSRKGDENE
jgi:CDP-diacylglycerol--serine O-phosphatidyltransferase